MKAFTVYLRVVVVLLVVGAIGLILFNNRAHTVNVWLFGLTDPGKPVNVVWVMLATALCTLTAWWLAWLGRGLIHDVREVRRKGAAAAVQNATDLRVAELAERQRQVEEKLKKTVGEVNPETSEIDF